MRSPSARVLINRVDIYFPIFAQDAEGAPSVSYAGAPTLASVACSVQAGMVEEVVDEQQRIVQERQYKVMVGAATNVPARAKLIYVDSSGVSHTLFARLERDEAGRGAAFVIRAIERV